ncbi:hypothetical protein NLG97_g1172 [Lecanicillium saksenae]|uniref:Uncharacterized protein n=1 Tax=Lecanicillium saksenae TaxID=468837 RepID=A0ACC1R8L0_9HYPO|nr:hypothetical protein NLG97_g1172 [Lecanicillium saksenae]
MPQPEVKKRNARGAGTSTTMEMPFATSAAKQRRTLTWHEAAEWQRDSKYILSGYRPEKADYLEILTSLTFLHNETCNVYTHLIGALLLPLIATTIMRGLSQSQFSIVSGTDYTMFGIFFCTLRWRKVKIGAYLMLGASALIPLLHGSQRYGLEYMAQYSGMNWYLLELAIYASGTAIYALRVPERFAPVLT